MADGGQGQTIGAAFTTILQNSAGNNCCSAVLLLCREIEITNPTQREKRARVLAFFDSGSQKSFISKKLAEELELPPIHKANLAMSGFGEKVPTVYKSTAVSVGIRQKDGTIIRIVTNTMKFPTQKLQVVSFLLQRTDLDGSETTRVTASWKEPIIIIGADYYFDFIKSAKRLPSGYYLIDSTVGYLLSGTGKDQSEVGDRELIQVKTAVCDTEIENFWKLGTVGTMDSPEQDDDEIALQQFFQKVKRDPDGRYTVSWPWKTKEPELKNYFGLCFGRLKSVLSKLRSDPGLIQKYKTAIADQLQASIIEEVALSDHSEGIIHYIPHQPVITPQKSTTKLRIVFDASAKRKRDQSLNENIYPGPTMLNDLCGILLRSRLMKTVLVADVEKAFHQVGLNVSDRDSTRFLWVKDEREEATERNLVVYRFKRIPFEVVASSFLLAATLRHHLSNAGTETANKVLKNLYVDNLIIETANDDAVKKYGKLKELFGDAKMNIREFMSNEKGVIERIPEADRFSGSEVKIFGINWNLDDDHLSINYKPNEMKIATKREMLKIVAEMFDLLGWTAPVILPLKLRMQSLWKKKYKWDDRLNKNDLDEWNEITTKWKEVEITIPRVALEPGKDVQLHILVDPSQNAYAAVAIYSCYQ